jgi:rRNA-processing protein FCF1
MAFQESYDYGQQPVAPPAPAKQPERFQPSQPAAPVVVVAPEPSIFDMFANKRRDVFKQVALALAFLLALAVHSAVVMYLESMASVLSVGQKIAANILYAVVVLLLLWTVKVLQ